MAGKRSADALDHKKQNLGKTNSTIELVWCRWLRLVAVEEKNVKTITGPKPAAKDVEDSCLGGFSEASFISISVTVTVTVSVTVVNSKLPSLLCML